MTPYDLIPLAQDHPAFGKAKIVACIATKKGEPLAYGFNRPKTHPLHAHFAKMNGSKDKIYLHAESDCIKNVLTKYNIKELNRTKLILHVARVYKSGNPALAKPCQICQSMIEWAGFIDDIMWTKHEQTNL